MISKIKVILVFIVVIHCIIPQHFANKINEFKHSFPSESNPTFTGIAPELMTGLSDGKFDHRREYSSNLYQVYIKYLKRRPNHQKCSQHEQSLPIDDYDLEQAYGKADKQIKEFIELNDKHLANNSLAMSFNQYIYYSNLKTKYNEFVTNYLAEKKCLNKYEIAIDLPSVVSEKFISDNEYCDLESDVSTYITCNPNYPYVRDDAKCNNLHLTNWGSTYHSYRRLLPPDYGDGVSQLRVASDGSALPNPRLVSNILMANLKIYDKKLTQIQIFLGQFLSHDVFKAIQYLGGGNVALDCCPPTVHPECAPMDNIPQDILSASYNQTCIKFTRAMASNTCSLGPRVQINAASPFPDLSQFYGGNVNNTNLLRAYRNGEMRGDLALDGTNMLPVAVLPRDQDTIDLNHCNPPVDRPYLTCFNGGDGIRSTQQELLATIFMMFFRRHNQHARALAKVNPEWDDETLFQEARRLMTAEYNMIIYSEYLPSVLGKDVINYFDLDVKPPEEYSRYDAKVNPLSIQSVGTNALRFGHSQVTSVYQVNNKVFYESYGFKLRERFRQASEIWDGNTNGVINGLTGLPARKADEWLVDDVNNFLYFDPRNPQINDLGAVNVQRGRDVGLPAYVYYLQLCTGFEVKSWEHLYYVIPEDNVNRMKTVYKHYKDIDLFVGGMAETNVNGSILGPTFTCLIGVQFHHLKYGNRFYFEHKGQSGSFTPDQLTNIKQTTSMANLLCKVTDFDSIQANPLYRQSESNPRILCKNFAEINYDFWREE